MADELLHHTDTCPAIFHIGHSTYHSSNFVKKEQQSSDSLNNVVVLDQENTSHVMFEEAESSHIVLETNEEVTNRELEMLAKCSTKCPIEILENFNDTVNKDECFVVGGVNGSGNRKEKKQRQRKRKVGKNKDVLLNWDSMMVLEKEKKGFVYSREEMFDFRFEGVEEQKKVWVELYCRLDPLVREEYDGLLVKCDVDDRIVVDFDPRLQFQKSVHLGEDCSRVADNTSDQPSCLPGSDETGNVVQEREFSEDDDDDDSDEDYSSIQRPAFNVTGEPDFDSGPPQDGLEFLRRVRWEAARIPNVKVSKVVQVKEQKPYMPQIPDIMECPKNLLPLKEWEDSFLANFSELRQEFSQLESQNSSTTNKIHSLPTQESIFFENFECLTSTRNSNQYESSRAIETCTDGTDLENCYTISDYPTLPVMLKMSPAARNSMLKKRISALEKLTTLLRNDCLWLFALCVAVDSPLDADSYAALRCLLRKCASLRAAKTEMDDEVVMLNILATISGRYFGQLEK